MAKRTAGFPKSPYSSKVPFGPVALAAVRYALPRQTYVTDVVSRAAAAAARHMTAEQWGGDVWTARIIEAIKTSDTAYDRSVWERCVADLESRALQRDHFTVFNLHVTASLSLRLFTDYQVFEKDLFVQVCNFLVVNASVIGAGQMRTVGSDIKSARLTMPNDDNANFMRSTFTRIERSIDALEPIS